MGTIFLQIFLLINVFFMGVLTAVGVRHLKAHYWPKPEEKPKLVMPAQQQVRLPPMVREHLVKEAEDNFLAQLNDSVTELQHDLKVTSMNLNKQLQQLGSEVAVSEKGRYFNMLEDLRKRTEIALSAAQSELDQHQQQLKVKMLEAMAAEQQMLVKQIDTKLADAVGSFLAEALSHNVDLGAQAPYLTALLEQHKDEFKREVVDEVAATK